MDKNKNLITYLNDQAQIDPNERLYEAEMAAYSDYESENYNPLPWEEQTKVLDLGPQAPGNICQAPAADANQVKTISPIQAPAATKTIKGVFTIRKTPVNYQNPLNIPGTIQPALPAPYFKVAISGSRKLPWGYTNREMDNLLKNTIAEELRKIQIANPDKRVILLDGGAVGVDQLGIMAAQHLGMPYRVYVPCENQEKKWPPYVKAEYLEMLKGAESLPLAETLAKEPYSPKNMLLRNTALVDDCDMALVCWDQSSTGTLDFINKVESIKKEVTRINLLEIKPVSSVAAPAAEKSEGGPTMNMNCLHCNTSVPVYQKINGPHIGLYCSVCHYHIKWVSKDFAYRYPTLEMLDTKTPLEAAAAPKAPIIPGREILNGYTDLEVVKFVKNLMAKAQLHPNDEAWLNESCTKVMKWLEKGA